MKKKVRQAWSAGDLFLIPLKNDTSAVGQVLNQMMENVVSCALFDIRVSKDEDLHTIPTISNDRLISLLSTTRERLDSGAWRVLGKRPIAVERHRWPNEEFRRSGWVGVKIRNAALVEDFLNAFHGLAPWDDWSDPTYLDKLLISSQKKPANLVFKDRH